MNRQRPFSHNTMLIFASQLVRYGAAALTWAVIARATGAAGLGQVQLAYAFCGWITLFLGFGIPVANIIYVGRGTYPVPTVIGNSFFFVGLQTTLALVLLWLGHPLIGKYVALTGNVYRLVLLWVPLQLASSHLLAVLSGRKAFVEQCWVNVVQGLVVLGTLTAVLLLGQSSLSAMMVCLIAGTGSAILLQLWFLREFIDVSQFAPSAELVRNSTTLGMKGYLANLSQFFTYRLDTFVVSYCAGTAALGVYALAYTTGELLWYMPTTLSTVLLPTTAGSSTEEANARTAQLCRLVSLLGLISGGALALAGPLILPWILGPGFAASVPLLWALLPGIVLFMVERLISADLTGRGYLQYATYGSLIAFVGTLILDLLFIPRFGVMAAAVCSSIIYIVESLYLLNRFHAVSGVRYRDLFFFTTKDLSVLKGVIVERPRAWLSARLRVAT